MKVSRINCQATSNVKVGKSNTKVDKFYYLSNNENRCSTRSRRITMAKQALLGNRQ